MFNTETAGATHLDDIRPVDLELVQLLDQ